MGSDSTSCLTSRPSFPQVPSSYFNKRQDEMLATSLSPQETDDTYSPFKWVLILFSIMSALYHIYEVWKTDVKIWIHNQLKYMECEIRICLLYEKQKKLERSYLPHCDSKECTLLPPHDTSLDSKNFRDELLQATVGVLSPAWSYAAYLKGKRKDTDLPCRPLVGAIDNTTQGRDHTIIVANEICEGQGGSCGQQEGVNGGGRGRDGSIGEGRDGEGSGSGGGQSGEGEEKGGGSGGGGNQEGGGSGDGGDKPGSRDNKTMDFPKIAEVFMGIIVAILSSTIYLHVNHFISSTTLELLCVTVVVGFLCCLTSMLHKHRNPRAAHIFGTIGAAATGLGLLILVFVPLPAYYTWMLVLAAIALLVICVWSLIS